MKYIFSNIMSPILWVLFCHCISLNSFAQEAEENNAVSTSLLKFNGGVAFPGGDLEERFGMAGLAGGGYYYKTNTNWLFGGEFDYYFGNEVKEDNLFGDFLTDGGYLIGVDGLLYNPVTYMRGYKIQVGGGKIFNLLSVNDNSGIVLLAHAGFLQHKISIFTPDQGTLPQLNGDMKKGFDRLTNGFSLSQYIGYFFMSDYKLVNFTLGFEITEAFTRSRRDINFNDMQRDDRSRMDILYGIKASWILPLYKRDQSNEYFY